MVRINGVELGYEPHDAPSPRVLRELDPRNGKSHPIQLERNPKINIETRYGKEALCLGPDEYYVLGDNRLASGDSRMIGPIKLNQIQGRMTRVWYSYDKAAHALRLGRIGKPVE